MTTKNYLLILLVLLLSTIVISSCSDNRCIKFDFITPINDTLNIYVYHITTFAHEQSESKLAIGQNKCEILNDSTRTFAESESFVQIDTIIGGKVYISASMKVVFNYSPQFLTFEIKELKPKDEIKPRLEYILACSDSCH